MGVCEKGGRGYKGSRSKAEKGVWGQYRSTAATPSRAYAHTCRRCYVPSGVKPTSPGPPRSRRTLPPRPAPPS